MAAVEVTARLTGGATPGWQPLPECLGCELPMKRGAYRQQGGYCRSCRPAGAEHPATRAERERLQDWQRLVNQRAREERQRAEERAQRRIARLEARRARR